MSRRQRALEEELLKTGGDGEATIPRIASIVREHMGAPCMYFVHDRPGRHMPPYIVGSPTNLETLDRIVKPCLIEFLIRGQGLPQLAGLHRCRMGSGSVLSQLCDTAGMQEVIVIPVPGAEHGQGCFVALYPQGTRHPRAAGEEVQACEKLIRFLVEQAWRQDAEVLRSRMLQVPLEGAVEGANIHERILKVLEEIL